MGLQNRSFALLSPTIKGRIEISAGCWWKQTESLLANKTFLPHTVVCRIFYMRMVCFQCAPVPKRKSNESKKIVLNSGFLFFFFFFFFFEFDSFFSNVLKNVQCMCLTQQIYLCSIG